MIVTIMPKRPRQIDSQRTRLDLRQLILLFPIIATGPTNINANPIDYTCNPYKDVAEDNTCLTVNDKKCDNPNHGGGGGDGCRNQDCIDCNYHCKYNLNGRSNLSTNKILTMLFIYDNSHFATGKEFDYDCYGCLNAQGCHYCPGDGECLNSNFYGSNFVSACTQDDYLSSVFGDEPSACIPQSAHTQDPLYEGNSWMYNMINVVDVWRDYGFKGEGIKIRINDDGVDVNNLEFLDRFDDVENSCESYLPAGQDDDHGTRVAGIIVGNADNDLCAVGIAHKAKFSSCNFFSGEAPSTLLAYKFETFDISQNSIGVP